MALILITHDLGVVGSVTDRMIVMYAGRVVESGTTTEVFEDPRHPYTIGLLESVPRLDSATEGRLPAIPGSPPTGYDAGAGCPFAPRCAHAVDECRRDDPLLGPVGRGGSHEVACFVDIGARRQATS